MPSNAINFSSENPFFTVKIQAEEVIVRKNNKDLFIVQFTPRVLLIDNLSNEVVYMKTLSRLKGLSFKGYDKAYREATSELNKNLEGVASGIIEAIL